VVLINNGPNAVINAVFKDPAVANLTVTGVACPAVTGGAIAPASANTTIPLLQGSGIIIPNMPSGATVTCQVTATVAAGATGTIKNTATLTLPPTGYNTETNTTNNTATDTDYPPPTLTKAFSPTTIQAGGVSMLTFTLTNPAGNPAINTMAFTDQLPLGLVIANPASLSNTCVSNANTQVTANPGGNTIAVQNLGMPAGASTCTVTVKVTNGPELISAVCPNPKRSPQTTNGPGNITGVVDVTNGITDQCLNITPVPVLSKAFSPTAITAGQTTILTFTIDNAASGVAFSGINYTDTLPAGLVVASGTVTTTCPSMGAVTAPAGGASIAVVGAAAPAAAECTISVPVTNAAATTSAVCPNPAGTFTTNGASNISNSANIMNGVTDQCVTIVAPPPSCGNSAQ
jgi:uncharacterized repeat protein (TIGR01451 family)